MKMSKIKFFLFAFGQLILVFLAGGCGVPGLPLPLSVGMC
jgi:hypothetical protein